MASAFGHAIAAATIGKVSPFKNQGARFWVLGIACSILPDIDVVAFRLGIPYDDLFGHRGFTHSFFFALLLAIGVVIAFYPQVKKLSAQGIGLFFYFFLCTASHSILDALTTGGRGVAFFAPFNNERYFLPWRVIKVSPIGIDRFFSEWGMMVLKSELLWIGLPCLGIILLSVGIRRLMSKLITKF